MVISIWRKILFVYLLSVVGQAWGQVIVVPESRELALAGVITEVHGYGPPGYGENKKTDSRITYWILELQTAITTPCTPERPEWAAMDCKAAKRLKLFFPIPPEGNDLEHVAKTMKDHRVLITGIVHRRDTLGEITPIYMNVTNIQAVPRAGGPHIQNPE